MENNIKKEINKIIEEHMNKKGFSMTKQISSGSHGFLSYTSPTYDNRTVYLLEEMDKLTKEGFGLDEDPGLFLLNAFTS